MTHRKLSRAAVLGVLFVVLVLGTSRHAAAQDPVHWQVVDIHGAATVTRPGVSPVSLTNNVALQGGDQIRTEQNGRVILRHGDDTVLVAPNSLVAIPAADTDLFTRVLQSFGTVLVNVAHRPDPHFEVHTPFLAAIVKGTTFTVSADAISSAVQVVNGMVNVVDAGGRQSVTVTAGQTARINSRTGGQLQVDGPRHAALPGDESANAKPSDMHGAAAPGPDGKSDMGRISHPIGLIPVDAGKASGGLLRNDDGAGASRGRSNATAGNGLSRAAEGANRADAAGGPVGGSDRPLADVAALIHANGAAPGIGRANGAAGLAALGQGGNGNAGGNGNGNGNAGGNGNSSNGNAGGNGNGNAGNGNGHGHS